jgi:hypothetical protein
MHDNYLKSCFFCPYTTVNCRNQQISQWHFNAHFNSRSYKCGFCDASYFRAIDVRFHEEARHEVIHDRYKCHQCDFKASTRKKLHNHANICKYS